MYFTGAASWGAPTNAAVLRAGNLRVSARTPPEPKEKQWFLQASKADRRGPVGDVRLARAAECLEGIEGIAAAFILSDTPLAARRISMIGCGPTASAPAPATGQQPKGVVNSMELSPDHQPQPPASAPV